MNKLLLGVLFFLFFLGQNYGQEKYKNDFDIGLGYSIAKTSSYLKLDYGLTENSGLYFKGHYERPTFAVVDSFLISMDTFLFPSFEIQRNQFIRLTVGYRHYFKNDNRKYIRSGWYLDSGVSYRIDIEDSPANDLGDFFVASIESTIGYKFILSNKIRVEPNAAFLFSGSFGGSNNMALFDFDLYVGASIAYSFGDAQLKKSANSKRSSKRKRKRRR